MADHIILASSCPTNQAPLTPIKRALIYTRTSTTAQSTDDQESACHTYALHRGWDVVGVHADLGPSGKLDARPGLQALLRDVRQGDAQAVLVTTLDRLARSATMHLELGRLFKEYQTQLVVTGEVTV